MEVTIVISLSWSNYLIVIRKPSAPSVFSVLIAFFRITGFRQTGFTLPVMCKPRQAAFPLIRGFYQVNLISSALEPEAGKWLMPVKYWKP